MSDDHIFFASSIAPVISGLSDMGDLAACVAITDHIAGRVGVAFDVKEVVNTIALPDLETTLRAFDTDIGGAWCSDTSITLARALKASGRVRNAWVYAYGPSDPDKGLLQHAVTLADVNGVIYLFDAYLNVHPVRKDGFTPLPFLEMLDMIVAGVPPQFVERLVNKKLYCTAEHRLEDYVHPIDQRAAIVVPRPGGPGRQIARARFSFGHVSSGEAVGWRPMMVDTRERLIKDGTDGNLAYLHLYPLWCERPYAAIADPSAQDVLQLAKDVVQGRITGPVGGDGARIEQGLPGLFDRIINPVRRLFEAERKH